MLDAEHHHLAKEFEVTVRFYGPLAILTIMQDIFNAPAGTSDR
jgi:hypothetical protein